MKKALGIIFAVVAMLVTLTSTVCFAGGREGVDLSLANQWEQRGNFSKTGYHFDQAAQQESNLDKRAKLHQRSLKAYLKTDDFNSMEEAANRIRQYAKDGGTSLLKELAPSYLEAGKRQAKNYNNAKAYELISFYLVYHQNERNKLADEFNAKGNKDLAQMLNPALKAFDCKSMLTKADKTDDVETSLNNYAQYASACAGMPASPNDCKAVFETAEATTDPLTKLRFYKAGKDVGCQISESAHQPIIEIIRKFAKTPDQAGSKFNENAANLGRSIMPAEVAEREVPEIVYYEKGVVKTFVVEAGEQLDHFVSLPKSGASISIRETADSDYLRIYPDGQIFGMNGPSPKPYQPVRFRATKKSTVTVKIY